MILQQTDRLKIQSLVLHETLLPLVLRIHYNIQIYLPSSALTIWPSDAALRQSRSGNQIDFLYFQSVYAIDNFYRMKVLGQFPPQSLTGAVRLRYNL